MCGWIGLGTCAGTPQWYLVGKFVVSCGFSPKKNDPLVRCTSLFAMCFLPKQKVSRQQTKGDPVVIGCKCLIDP